MYVIIDDMTFKKNLIVVNGLKTFYWEKNQGQENVIILLHGFPGNHEGLVDMANGLGNYRIIIPDLPACGLSERLAEKQNLENYSQWMNSFLELLSINRPIVVGHSFGSRIALVFDGHYPEKVKELVLITPVVKVEGLIVRFLSVEYEIAKILPQYLRSAWLSNKINRKVENTIIFKSASPKRRQELMAREKRELKHLNPQTSIELFDEFYRFSLIPIGETIKTKSLVIAGDLDEIAPLDSVRELAEQLTNSEFVTMKNCGHIVVAEKPLTTASIIRNWLANNSRR
jgi:pimeloyl-ACP methyl ester carboxylesterase